LSHYFLGYLLLGINLIQKLLINKVRLLGFIQHYVKQQA